MADVVWCRGSSGSESATEIGDDCESTSPHTVLDTTSSSPGYQLAYGWVYLATPCLVLRSSFDYELGWSPSFTLQIGSDRTADRRTINTTSNTHTHGRRTHKFICGTKRADKYDRVLYDLFLVASSFSSLRQCPIWIVFVVSVRFCST